MSRSPVDPDALIELVDRDFDLLEALVTAFLEECPDYLDAIRAAVTEQDPEALQREAHKLKGAVGNLRAGPALEATQKLEEIAESEDFQQAEPALDALEQELDRLRTALLTLREKYENADAITNGNA